MSRFCRFLICDTFIAESWQNLWPHMVVFAGFTGHFFLTTMLPFFDNEMMCQTVLACPGCDPIKLHFCAMHGVDPLPPDPLPATTLKASRCIPASQDGCGSRASVRLQVSEHSMCSVSGSTERVVRVFGRLSPATFRSDSDR